MSLSARNKESAAAGLRALLFQLDDHQGSHGFLVHRSRWIYIDNRGKPHGPFPFGTMLAWIEGNAFPSENIPVQHEGLRCWVPLWFLLYLKHFTSHMGEAVQAKLVDEDMIDVETALAAVREAREKHIEDGDHDRSMHSMLSISKDFPETSDAATMTAPMDYEISKPEVSYLHNVRVFVIVDTSVLLSHLHFVEKVFVERFAPAAPELEALVVIPWATLCELDSMKDASDRPQASSMARRSLQWIRAMSSTRDSFVRIQTVQEHHSLLSQRKADSTALRDLQNDDLIILTCLFWQNHVAKSLSHGGCNVAAILLSNDKGMCIRARATGVQCFTAVEFPASADSLQQCISKIQTRTEENIPNTSPLYSNRGEDEKVTKRIPLDMAQGDRPPYLTVVSSMHARGNKPIDQDFGPLDILRGIEHSAKSQDQVHPADSKRNPVPQPRHWTSAAPTMSELQLQTLSAILHHGVDISGTTSTAGRSFNTMPVQAPHRETLHPESLAQSHATIPMAADLAANLGTKKDDTEHYVEREVPTPHRSSLHPGNAPSLSSADGEGEAVSLISDVVREGLGPAVAFYRQQDLGSLWLELLEDKLRPPWDAAAVLRVMAQHGTTFWEYLSRSQLDACRHLERDIRKKTLKNVHTAADQVRHLAVDLLRGLDQAASSGEAPDPSEVPDFVSLGTARLALEHGLQRLANL